MLYFVSSQPSRGGGISCGNLGFFIYIYSLGAFIRLGILNFLFNKKLLKILLVFSILFISLYIMTYIIPNDYINMRKTCKYTNMNSPIIIILALYCFNYFKSLNIKHNKWINSIASSVFGVYLIHDNNFVRPYMWKRLVHFININSVYCIFNIIGICLIVFFVCILTDKIIKVFIEKHFEKISIYIDMKTANIYQKLTGKTENN